MSNSQFPIVLPSLNDLTWLQGSASELTHKLRLMVMIQPNCPGCHLHALPLANEIALQNEDFDIYCLSTAFEDFEFNNESAARLLLDGKHVGESKRRLGERVTHIPKIPLVHDRVIPREQASTEMKENALEVSKAAARQQLEGRIPKSILEDHLAGIGFEVLPEKIPEVFYRVGAVGTPAWVLHDDVDGVVVDVKFGQLSKEELGLWVEKKGGVKMKRSSD